VKVLPGFLDAREVAELVALGTASGWTAGRQGTGYDKLELRTVLPADPGSLIARALAHVGTPFGDFWDVYLIRYLAGSHIPPHTDPAQHGRRHHRLNAMLVPADGGGELRVDGVPVELATGDAIVFAPDREVHEVSPVVGSRLLFSVGAWV